MFKKIMTLMLAVAVAISLVGCGCSKSGDEGKVKLAKYKGVVVYHDDVKVTDDDVKKTIDGVLSQGAQEKEVKKGKVGESDKVNVNYKGKIDYKGKREAFEGGTADNQDIDLSADASKFIEGFTSSLVGHKVGEKFTAKLRFPDDYNNQATVKGKSVSLAGKPVWFTFKINKLTKKETPKLTDKYVKENATSLFGAKKEDKVTTVKALKKYMKKEMKDYNIWNKVWAKITEDTKIEKYDSKRVEKEKKNSEKQLLQQYQQRLQDSKLTIDDYLKACQMSKKDWNKKLTEQVKNTLKEKMIIEKIADEENLTVSDKTYKEKGKELAKQQGTTLKNLEKQAGKEEIKLGILYEKVRDFIIDNIKEKKGSEPTTTPAPITTKKAKTTKKDKK